MKVVERVKRELIKQRNDCHMIRIMSDYVLAVKKSLLFDERETKDMRQQLKIQDQ